MNNRDIILSRNRTYVNRPWWRHQMETFSALLAICAGNSPVPGEFPAQRPITRSFDVFFDLRLNKRFSKQSWGWWFETLSGPLWHHRNATSILERIYHITVGLHCIYILTNPQMRWKINKKNHPWCIAMYPQTYHSAHWWPSVVMMPTLSHWWQQRLLLWSTNQTHQRWHHINSYISVAARNLTHWGRDQIDAISQTTFSNAFSWMKMYEFRLRFHWSLFPRVQLTIFQLWFR